MLIHHDNNLASLPQNARHATTESPLWSVPQLGKERGGRTEMECGQILPSIASVVEN